MGTQKGIVQIRSCVNRVARGTRLLEEFKTITRPRGDQSLRRRELFKTRRAGRTKDI